MAVAGVEICPESAQIDGDLSRRVGAVDDGQNARLSRPGADLLDGEDDGRRRGDVAEKDDPGSGGDAR